MCQTKTAGCKQMLLSLCLLVATVNKHNFINVPIVYIASYWFKSWTQTTRLVRFYIWTTCRLIYVYKGFNFANTVTLMLTATDFIVLGKDIYEWSQAWTSWEWNLWTPHDSKHLEVVINVVSHWNLFSVFIRPEVHLLSRCQNHNSKEHVIY